MPSGPMRSTHHWVLKLAFASKNTVALSRSVRRHGTQKRICRWNMRACINSRISIAPNGVSWKRWKTKRLLAKLIVLTQAPMWLYRWPMCPLSSWRTGSMSTTMSLWCCTVCCHTNIKCPWWMWCWSVRPIRRYPSSRRNRWLYSVASVDSLSIRFSVSTRIVIDIRWVMKIRSMNFVVLLIFGFIIFAVRTVFPSGWNGRGHILCANSISAIADSVLPTESGYIVAIGCQRYVAFVQSGSHYSEAYGS